MKTFRLAGTVVNSDDVLFMEALERDYISASKVEKILSEAGGEDVTFNLNSGGGSVLAGSEIYTMLSGYSGRVVVNITGLSASIASVFMLGADEVNISHQAQIMVHQPHVYTDGVVDKLSTERTLNMLDSTEKSLAKVYMKKTGLSEERVLEMMFNETWLTSDQALELGFVDNIYNDEDKATEDVKDLVAMVSNTGEQLETLQLLKEMRETSMDKTFFEKVKALLQGEGAEASETVEEVTEEVSEATDEPVEAEEGQSGTDTPEEETEGVEEKSEQSEDTEDKADETTALLEQAMNEIKALREDNKVLKEQLASLETAKAEFEAKDSKAQAVVNQLNELLNSEEAKVVSVTQNQTTNTMPNGYKGIRSGGIK